MKYSKKNHVSLNWLDYNLFLLGQAKIGKSTVIYEACKKTAGEDGYLFLEIGQERGADAIEGINYVNCPTWDMAYDEVTNSIGFADIVDDIIQNKETDYKDLKVVVWDTYDQLIDIAEAKTIALHNRKNPDKPIDTINSAFGGFGKGLDKALDLMIDKMAALRSVGVATIVIGHVKTKDVTDVVSGESYQTLTSDQTQKYFNAMVKNMHFVGLAYIDREIVREKTGKKVIRDNVKIDEIVNKVASESRKIKFRDDSYCIDCGSRFASIANEIDLNADALIKCLNDAIATEQNKSGISLEQAQQNQAIQDQKKAKRAAEVSAKASIDPELPSQIAERIQELAQEQKLKLAAWMKANGCANRDELVAKAGIVSLDSFDTLVSSLS